MKRLFAFALVVAFLFAISTPVLAQGKDINARNLTVNRLFWSYVDIRVIGASLAVGVGEYYNFGSTIGSTGYGFRDNSGTLEWKDSGGSWAAFGVGVGVLLADGSVPLTANWDAGDYEIEAKVLDAQGTSSIGATSFTGTGNDDLSTSGTFNGDWTFNVRVEIDGGDPTSPNSFKWSVDNGSTWVKSVMACQVTPVALEYTGVTVTWVAATGHDTGDYWNFTLTADTGVLNSTGAWNVGGSLFMADSGVENLFIGSSVGGGGKITGKGNAFIGYQAGYGNTSGNYNFAAGYKAGYGLTDGLYNLALGYEAGSALASSDYNTYIGYQAGKSGDDHWNVGVGALVFVDPSFSGQHNVAVGFEAGKAHTTATGNVYLGSRAGTTNISAAKNTFVGYQAGYSAIEADNTFVGYQAGRLSTTNSIKNTFMGSGAGAAVTSGKEGTFIGYNAGIAQQSGFENTYLGYIAGTTNQSGSMNTYIGSQSGFLNTGEENTFVGRYSGYRSTTGDYNVFLGRDAGPADAAATIDSSIAIGYKSHPTAANQFLLGSDDTNGSITDAYFGQGVTKASPAGITLNASGGSGTDNAGGDFTIAGGKATGNADPGDIIFQVSDPGASGATLQTLTEKARITEDGLDVAGNITAQLSTALTDTVSYVERLSHVTSGTPAASIGVGTEFEVETSSGNNEILATIDVIASDVTSGAEDGDIVFKTMVAGAAATEAMRITSGNDVEIADCLMVENEIRLGTNGSASDPGFTWTDDDDTGLYRMSENIFAIAAGGAEVLRFSNAEIGASKRLKLSSGALLFSGADLEFGSGNSTAVKMTLKSDGKFDVPGIYDETDASMANVFVASDGSLRRSTSTALWTDAGAYLSPATSTDSVNIATGESYMQNGSTILKTVQADFNTMVGLNAGPSVTADGDYNSYFGESSGYSNISGDRNSNFGFEAGYLGLLSDNVHIGYRAGYQNLGNESVYIGTDAGYSAGSSVDDNVVIGYKAGSAIGNATTNVYIGHSAGTSSTGGGGVSIGAGSMANASATGNNNTNVGFYSGNSIVGGYDNVNIGNLAGRYVSGGYGCVNIGRTAGPASGDGNHAYSIALGYGAKPDASNQFILGASGTYGNITVAYLGQGITEVNPDGIILNASGGSGSNNAGGHLTLAGGKGTGNATPGYVIFKTSTKGASGVALQGLKESGRFTETEFVMKLEQVYDPSSLQIINAAGNAILANATVIKLNPTGDYTLTSTPTIADGTDGQILFVICANSEANVVTVQDEDTLGSSNLELGAATRAISGKDVLQLLFDGTDWVEVSFQDN